MTLQLGPQAPVRGPLGSVSNQPWEAEGLVRALTEDGPGTSLVVGPVVFCVSSAPAWGQGLLHRRLGLQRKERRSGLLHIEAKC